MKKKDFKLMNTRRRIAASKASIVAKRRMGHEVENFEPDDFKASEYHSLRWGWFYYMINKARPDILFKVAYRYDTKDFCVTTYKRRWIDYLK